MFFGAILVGPPGSGKTTLCNALHQMFTALSRKCATVNLDPANDVLPYPCSINICELIVLEDVLKQKNLGPNGALMYCMDYLLENIDWLIEQLTHQFELGFNYVIFDCPGQVELYTHETSFLSILRTLVQKLDARITALHLLDSIACLEGAKYISGLLTSLSCQLLLELPHINLLTKIDLLKHQKKNMVFQLSYFTEIQDLRQLLIYLDQQALVSYHPFQKKYMRLQEEICQLIEDFNICGFFPLDVNSKQSMLYVVRQMDLGNGFSLSGALRDPAGLFEIAVDPCFGLDQVTIGDIKEMYPDTTSSDTTDSDDLIDRPKIFQTAAHQTNI